MTKDWKKVALRKSYFRRWCEGYELAYGVSPSDELKTIYKVGFNMGYKAHKTKKL